VFPLDPNAPEPGSGKRGADILRAQAAAKVAAANAPLFYLPAPSHGFIAFRPGDNARAFSPAQRDAIETGLEDAIRFAHYGRA
jgi:hypothetical protein